MSQAGHCRKSRNYLGFRLFDVGGLGAEMGLWDPKWDPKNSGCLAGGLVEAEELRVSGRSRHRASRLILR